MDSNPFSRFSCNHSHRQRAKQKVNPIVDDPRSSNPHSLLPWLKRQLQTFAPVNNADFNSTLPPSSLVTSDF